jgi:hypothetical protein
MGNRGSQFDVPHSLTTDFGFGYFHTAAVTNNTFVPYPLELTAMALPILYRAKYALAKESLFFRFQGSIVYGLRLFYLTFRPFSDLFR